MKCPSCAFDSAYVLRYHEDGTCYCDKCGNAKANTYDVYLGPEGGIRHEENLADPKTGEPIPYSTKGEKAAIMKRLGLVQSPLAERQHGYRREEFSRKTYFI